MNVYVIFRTLLYAPSVLVLFSYLLYLFLIFRQFLRRLVPTARRWKRWPKRHRSHFVQRGTNKMRTSTRTCSTLWRERIQTVFVQHHSWPLWVLRYVRKISGRLPNDVGQVGWIPQGDGAGKIQFDNWSAIKSQATQWCMGTLGSSW